MPKHALTPDPSMAKAFLARLPEVERGEEAREDQPCPICMEEYSTTPCASGKTERAVRLPCSHVVGFECISTWLMPKSGRRSNNSCPICRRELFPVAPPFCPTLRLTAWWTEHMRIHIILRRNCTALGSHLGLESTTIAMAVYIANRLHDRGSMGDRPLIAIAAASVYMAGHLLGNGSLFGAISEVAARADMGNVSVGAIRHAYIFMYQYRRRLIDWDLHTRVLGCPFDEVDDVLPLPLL